MNMKSLKAQFIGAIAMVLVSAIAMGSSTYAWFSMNSKVTAKGMEVKATSDATLLISDAASGTFSDSVTIASTSTSMKPATSYDGSNFAILDSTKAKVTQTTAYTAVMNDGSALTAAGLKTESTNSNSTYWKDTTVYLKYSDASAGSVALYVSEIRVAQNAADSTKTMLNAVRVSVTYGGATFVFNPNSGTADTVGKYANSAWTLSAPSYTTYATTIGNVSGTAAPAVIRIWFEGQDTACFTDNVTTENLTVEVDFTTDQPT